MSFPSTQQPDQREHEIHIRVVVPTSEVDSSTPISNEVTMSYMLLGEFQQMLRNLEEEMEKTLKRFAKNVQAKLQKHHQHSQHGGKKNKKQQHGNHHNNHPSTGEEEEEFYVSMRENGDSDEKRINLNGLTNAHFQSGMVLHVRDPYHHLSHPPQPPSTDSDQQHHHYHKGDSHHRYLTFTVVTNAPTVTSLTTYPKTHFTIHCPIVPVVQSEFADDYRCLWYIESSPKSKDYQLVSRDKVLIPDRCHIGCAVKVFVSAIRYEGESNVVLGRAYVSYLQHSVINCPNRSSIDGIECVNRLVQLRYNYLFGERDPSTSTTNMYLTGTIEEQLHEQQFIESIHKHVYRHDINVPNQHTDTLRIVCYNVLSDGYANQEKDKTSKGMYYYLHDALYLQPEYRSQRIIYELLAYRADIIALQECDRKIYEQYYLPLLGLYGYVGHYSNKVSQVQEGCAMFIRTRIPLNDDNCTDSMPTYVNSKIEVEKFIDLPYKNIFRQNDSVLHKTLYRDRPDLMDIIGGKLGTIGQIAILRYKGDIGIIIGNTHLFYHPLASYIRLLQIQTLLQRIQEIEYDLSSSNITVNIGVDEKGYLYDNVMKSYDDTIDTYYLQREEILSQSLLTHSTKPMYHGTVEKGNCGVRKPFSKIGHIVLGDLNSTSDNSGVIEFLNRGSLRPITLAKLWERLIHFAWGDCAIETADASEDIEQVLTKKHLDIGEDEETFASMDMSLGPLSVDYFNRLKHNLYNVTPTEKIGYSNFVAVFKEHLDYIYASKDVFVTEGLAPMASREVLEEETALPNSMIPSDHVSLLADLRIL